MPKKSKKPPARIAKSKNATTRTPTSKATPTRRTSSKSEPSKSAEPKAKTRATPAERLSWLLPTWVAVEFAERSTLPGPVGWGAADAARVLASRFRFGPEGPEWPGVVDPDVDDKPPAWFEGWARELEHLRRHIDDAFHELLGAEGRGVELPLPLLRVERDPGRPGYQSRVLLPPSVDMAETMVARGCLVALKVRRAGAHFDVLDGRQRLSAARSACVHQVEEWLVEWESVDWAGRRAMGPPSLRVGTLPCDVEEVDEQAAAEVEVITNSLRRPLEALDLAENARRLKDVGLSVRAIATRLGKNYATVANALSLCNLVPKLWEALVTRTLPLACGYELSRVALERQEALWGQVQAAPNKLQALRALLAPGDPTWEAKPENQRARLQRVRTALKGREDEPGEASLVCALIDWVQGEPSALGRLPPAVRALLDTGKAA